MSEWAPWFTRRSLGVGWMAGPASTGGVPPLTLGAGTSRTTATSTTSTRRSLSCTKGNPSAASSTWTAMHRQSDRVEWPRASPQLPGAGARPPRHGWCRLHSYRGARRSTANASRRLLRCSFRLLSNSARRSLWHRATDSGGREGVRGSLRRGFPEYYGSQRESGAPMNVSLPLGCRPSTPCFKGDLLYSRSHMTYTVVPAP